MYNDEQEDSNSEKAKQAAGQVAKQVGKKAGETGKKLGKKFIKFLIKTGLIKYVIIGILIAIILIIIIVAAGSWYIHLKNAVFPGDEDAEGYSQYCPQEYFNNIYVSDEGTLMAATSVEDLWNNDKRYKRYLSNVDALAYLLNAQVVSQSPYIESAEKSDLNGTIKFYRNDSEIPMKYVPQDIFDGYVYDYNNNGNQEAKNKAMSCFTINSNGTIKVAYQQGDTEYVESLDEGYAYELANQIGASVTKVGKNSQGRVIYRISSNNSHMYTKNISYRNIIQNYSLPFELLWAIVVMADNGSSNAGNSEDFAHALASMAYDGEIHLVIDDNYETIDTQKIYGYDIVKYQSFTNIALRREGFQIDNGEDVNTVQEKEHFVTEYKKTENNTTPTVRIRKIESWCAVYEGRESFSTSTMSLPGEVDQIDNSTSKWEVISSDDYTMHFNECENSKIKDQFTVDEKDASFYTLEYKSQIRTRKENETTTTTRTSTKTTSSSANSVTPKYNDELTDLFKVTPMAVVKRYLTKSNYKSFIRVLEKNTTTANMVDLINYIFNQVTGTDKYGEDLEFESVWKSSGFVNVGDNGNTISGDTIQERIWIAFKNAGYSDYAVAGLMGNIEQESGFNPSVTEISGGGGFGLVQWTLQGIKSDLAAYAQSKGASVEDEEIQINFLLGQLDETGQSDACRYAKPQQVINFDRTASKGPRACYSGWKNATSVEDATYAFCWFYEGPADQYANIENRYSAAKKYYDKFHGTKIGTGDGDKDESSDTLGIKGYHTSSITGKKFTLYVQDVPGTSWYSVDGCFHCSLGTIISGFGYKKGPNTLTGFRQGSGCFGNRSDFTTKAGCQQATVYGANSNDIKRYLQKGEVIFFKVEGGTVTTDNGAANYSMHWLALLDYKNENGTDKVYVHDPWGGNPSRGWGKLSSIASVIVEYVHVWK